LRDAAQCLGDDRLVVFAQVIILVPESTCWWPFEIAIE